MKQSEIAEKLGCSQAQFQTHHHHSSYINPASENNDEHEATSSDESPSNENVIKDESFKHILDSVKIGIHIGNIFKTLDHLGQRMQDLRLATASGGSVSDADLHSAVNLLGSLDQLEFDQSTTATGGRSSLIDDSSRPRRADWLTKRLEAERWSRRLRDKTQTILEGLVACEAFRRSNFNTESARRRPDFFKWSSSPIDLEQMLSDVLAGLPELSISSIEAASDTSALLVKVGEVMHCSIVIRRLIPEHVIVRGINEPMLLSSSSTDSNPPPPQYGQQLCAPLHNLLIKSSSRDSTKQGDGDDDLRKLVHSLLSNRQSAVADLTPRSRSLAFESPSSGRLVRHIDLTRPSQHGLFRRISQLASTALLHFANDAKAPSTLRSLLTWLHAYRDLFQAPCRLCGQMLGQQACLPVWRTYVKLEAQHEHCQSIA